MNVLLTTADGEATLAIPLASRLLLRVGIGSASDAHHNTDRAPLPFAPQQDTWLDVVVTSLDFAILDGDVKRRHAAEGRLLLPKDGPARTKDRSRYVKFQLMAPERPGICRLRIGIYHQGALIQGHHVEATVGDRSANVAIRADYSVSEGLEGLSSIPERARFSIVANLDPTGEHTLVVRSANPSPSDPATTFSIRADALKAKVFELRRLAKEHVTGRERQSRGDLESALRDLAPLGQDLYLQLQFQTADLLPVNQGDRPLVHIGRTLGSSFTLPWQYLYEIPLEDPNQIRLCPVVAEWDDGVDLFVGYPRECPRSKDADHSRNLLCPWGFWGFRQPFEAPPSTRDVGATIPVFPSSIVTAAVAERLNKTLIDAHLAALGETFGSRFPGTRVETARTKAQIRSSIGRDLPLVYFFCHGVQPYRSAETWLEVGRGEAMTPADVQKWFLGWRREDLNFWSKVRPLVLINACHSVAIEPETFLGYVDVFGGAANASGLIGTEIDVPEVLAAAWAAHFFSHLLAANGLAGEAIHAARMDFLRKGNLFGLVYSAYCWSHLRFEAAAA